MKTTNTTFAKRALYLGVAPAVLLYLMMGFGPSIATFILSFTNISGIRGVEWHFIGLDNYKEFFVQQSSRDLIQVVKNTLIFCIEVTIIQNAIALPIALALNSKMISGRNFFRAVIFLPVVLGVMVTSLIWMEMLNPLNGPVQTLIGLFGLNGSFFQDANAALGWCIFTQIWMAMGYSMVINLAGLQAIPQELYEAGEMDGTTRMQALRHITFPMLWPVINVNIILAVIGSLQSYQIQLFATGGNWIPTQTFAGRVIYYGFNINAHDNNLAMRQGYGATWSMMLFVFVLIATLTYQRIVNRRDSEA